MQYVKPSAENGPELADLPQELIPTRTIRLSDEFIASVDAWAAKQEDHPGRSEAIRRLVEVGLEGEVFAEANLSPREHPRLVQWLANNWMSSSMHRRRPISKPPGSGVY